MTATKANPSSHDLKARSVKVETELAVLRGERLLAAQRAAVLAFLGGRQSDEVSSVRAQIRRLTDILEGLRDLSTEVELEELDTEIAAREKASDKEAERVEKLRIIATRGDAAIEGTGNAFGQERRRDRAARNDDFEIYASANNALRDERRDIESLKKRRCELTGEPYFAPPNRAALL